MAQLRTIYLYFLYYSYFFSALKLLTENIFSLHTIFYIPSVVE